MVIPRGPSCVPSRVRGWCKGPKGGTVEDMGMSPPPTGERGVGGVGVAENAPPPLPAYSQKDKTATSADAGCLQDNGLRPLAVATPTSQATGLAVRPAPPGGQTSVVAKPSPEAASVYEHAVARYSRLKAGAIAAFQSDDRDFRFMGTLDLLDEVKEPTFSADETMQKRLRQEPSCLSTAVLKLRRDPSSEVQSLAMKCLPLLEARVRPNAVSSIAAHLSVHVLPEAGGSAGKSSSSRAARSSSGGGSGDAVPGSQSLRDVAGLAFKSMVATLPSGGRSAMAVVSPLASRLLAALPEEGAPANSRLAAGVLESLELLADVLLRFPRQLVSSHSIARDALLPAMTLTDASASPTVRVALESALARSAGWRLVPHLRGIVPPLVSIASSSRGADDDDDEEDFSYDVPRDEQPEVALTALDSLVRQVPGPMAPYVSYVLPLALALSKHDSSYINGGAGSGEDGHDMEEDAAGSRVDGVEYDEDGFREDEGDYSDDEDASWRVRRAAVWLCHALVQVDRVVAAVGGVSSRDTYVSISRTLSARFSKREEVVKLDVFDAFRGLLAVIAAPAPLARDRTAMRGM
ncbi:hypothetical protein MMPV_004065 [Pyropia vietnamensis]